MQRIQYNFHEMHKDKISDNVVLKVEGGLEYRARYDKMNGRLINFETFFLEICMSNGSVLLFLYILEIVFFW